MTLLEWVAAGVALVGTVLVSRRRRIGFVFWMVSNAAFVVVGLHARLWGVALLFGAYFVTSVYGWRRWGIRESHDLMHAEFRDVMSRASSQTPLEVLDPQEARRLGA